MIAMRRKLALVVATLVLAMLGMGGSGSDVGPAVAHGGAAPSVVPVPSGAGAPLLPASALAASQPLTVSLPLIALTEQLSPTLRFAVVGDYGKVGTAAADVAALVRGWSPALVITTGDNNYDFGEQATIDANIGQYYASFIGRYRGSYGPGATRNRFFPSLGNHDWYTAGAAPYLSYFTLPGNERYYDFVRGPVHFFALDSDPNEPDGITVGSTQALWLEQMLASSTSLWQVVYFHHPPYSSGSHGNTTAMQWPFKEWGVDLVLSGHDHTYERIVRDGLTYVVDGLGGRSIYSFDPPYVEGSLVRYSGDYGAVLVDASTSGLTLSFITRAGLTIDSVTLSP